MFTRKVLKSAWVSSLPVLMGYLTMGFAAGVLFAGRIQITEPLLGDHFPCLFGHLR